MINAIGDVGPCAHVEVGGNPFERHGCLGPQALGDPDLVPVTFRGALQMALGPLEPRALFPEDAHGLVLFGLLDLVPGDVFRVIAPLHGLQQFLVKFFAAQRPAAPDLLPYFGLIFPTTQLHAPAKLPPTGGAVFGDAGFTQHPVGPQPLRPFRTGLQVGRVTAPGIIAELINGLEEFGARGIEMHVIASRAQVPRAAAIDNERFVAAAEEVAEIAVPAIESGGVGAQQPFHARHEVGARSFHHEMKVVAHQTISVHLPAGFLASFTQGFEKALAVLIIMENIFAPVAAVHEVVDRPFVLHAQPSGHGNNVSNLAHCVNTWD